MGLSIGLAFSSLWARFPMGLVRFLGSLRLAVVLIALYAAVIAWASFLESSYGTSAVHFAIYKTWWFLGLNVFLALNVFFAALVRFPWQRRHIGFVITHLGILTLMAGCLLSWLRGIEAQLPVVEGHSSGRAYQDSQHIRIQIAFQNSSSADKGEAALQTVQIPFASGPFNWDDYHAKLFWFPWRLAHRSQGLLFDREGICLEALNYNNAEHRVQLRLTIDGTTEEFWLAAAREEASQANGKHAVESSARRVTVTMPQDAVDLGFLVYLHKFQAKLDPGSVMPSHYSSQVDFIDRHAPHKPLQENVVITLNAPVDFTDPQSGRAWRLFQSGFDGPWKAGTRQFQAMAGDDHSRDQVYLSILTVSYDPGRALKYTGSLLIVLGIALVYYLRKYFMREPNSA